MRNGRPPMKSTTVGWGGEAHNGRERRWRDSSRDATLPLYFGEEGGWDEEKVSSSVLFLVFVQRFFF